MNERRKVTCPARWLSCSTRRARSAGERLLQFVHEQHGRLHAIHNIQRPARALLRLTHEGPHEGAHVERERGTTGFVAQRFRKGTLTGSRHAQKQHATSLGLRVIGGALPQGSQAKGFEGCQAPQRVEALPAATQREQAALGQGLGLELPDGRRLQVAMTYQGQTHRAFRFVACQARGSVQHTQ